MGFDMKKGLLILSIILLSISCLPFISGVSISPSRVILEFVPNSVYKDVANFGTGGRTNFLAIGSLGDFNITFNKDFLDCDIEPCLVNYTVHMPKSFPTPGRKQALIVVHEAFQEEQTGIINAVVSVSMQVYIDVPYPGKYLELQSFEATNVAAGENVSFAAFYLSRGNETINTVSGTVSVYDKDDKLIGTVNTNTRKNAKLNDEVRLMATWPSGDYKQGNYHSKLLVTYDGKKANASADFKLGGLDVSLINYTKEIIIGGIKPFQAVVDSVWSEAIPDVRAQVTIINSTNLAELTTFETLTRSLPPWGRATIEGYFDTAALGLGNYKLKIVLLFQDLKKEYNGTLSIVNPPPPPKVKKPNIFTKLASASLTVKVLVMALLILLIIVIIVLILTLLPRKKKQENKDTKPLK